MNYFSTNNLGSFKAQAMTRKTVKETPEEKEETTNKNVETPENKSEKTEGAKSYKEIIANQPVETTPKEDLYSAYWTMYRDDFEQSNIGLGSNEFANCSKMSVDNNQKIITNENDAKTHIQTFIEKLTQELKKQGKYDANMEEAMKFVEDNFRWDKYFEKYPNANANKLELIYLQALASAADKNEIASIFIVDDLPEN